MTTLKQKIIHHSTQKLAAIAGITLLAINTPTVIHAQTHVFPDLSKYTPVDVKKYIWPAFNGDRVYFSTPNELACGFEFGESASCQGWILSYQQNSPVPTSRKCQAFDVETNSGKPATISTLDPKECNLPADTRVVPVGHKITFKGKTCAVGPHDLTACTDGKHGFVLQPGNTWVF